MNPLSLYLVRHGRTVYNTQNRVQGWCDSPLTAEGRRSVRVTAEHLRGRAFAAAYSSPSGRTMETAREILALHPGTPLTSDGDLREFGFGEFEAGPEAQLFAQIDAPTLFGSIFDGSFPGLPGGERADRYLERVAAAFERITRRHDDVQEVLVVGHGVTLLAYLTMVGHPLHPLHPLPNASVSVVEIGADGSRRLTAFGIDPSGQGIPSPATTSA